MLSLKTQQASKIRTLFEICDPVLSEGPLFFDASGMDFTGSNYVVLADCKIFGYSPDVEYKYTFEEKKTSLGVNFKLINDALSCVTPNDVVEIIATKEGIQSSRPYFTIIVTNAYNYSFTTKIALLLLETETVQAPMTEFDSVVSMSSASFLKVLRFLARKGEYVQIYSRQSIDDKDQSHTYVIIRTKGDECEAVFSEKIISAKSALI